MTKNDLKEITTYITENIKLIDVIHGYGFKPRQEVDDRYTMTCPFHSEDTPSLKIYEKSFFCYGCGAGYSVIDFIMMQENVTFMDVINRYKDKVSIGSGENIYQKILKQNKEKEINMQDYMLSSKFRLGIILREFLKKNPSFETIVDRCFYDIDNFYEDFYNVDKEKIDCFEETILERIK